MCSWPSSLSFSSSLQPAASAAALRSVVAAAGGTVPSRLSGLTPLLDPIEVLRLMWASPPLLLSSLPPLAITKIATAIASTTVEAIA